MGLSFDPGAPIQTTGMRKVFSPDQTVERRMLKRAVNAAIAEKKRAAAAGQNDAWGHAEQARKAADTAPAPVRKSTRTSCA